MLKTLIVVDKDLLSLSESVSGVISFDEYLHDYPKKNERRTRIINLCDTERYLSQGYYCSLLAEARQHSVLPSVKTINDLRGSVVQMTRWRLNEKEQAELSGASSEGGFYIYLGQAQLPALQKIASRLFRQYPAPVLAVTVSSDREDELDIKRLSFCDLDAEARLRFVEVLAEFTRTRWKTGDATRRYRWDMAILVDPDEMIPPSNQTAIRRFIKAAGKLGIHARTVTATELVDVNHYDALFIRETTAIDHHTYRIACEAELNGLVVLDDPTSILRCCNKVFLHDVFSYQQVPSLKTQVVVDASDETLSHIEKEFGYPLVLKMPEGSFSQGVYKISDRSALCDRLTMLFAQSALVLAQEYLYTDYDWRIGVLNGRAIYACRYYMARNHWQIYNHGAKRFSSGAFDSMPTFEVPKVVLDAALRAARAVGSGLYGVDIKAQGNRAYVLEVNDNPSIDHKVEDSYVGEELYMQVMAEFLRRLELRGR